MLETSIQVLLVEDNPADANLLRRVFTRAGRETWQMVQVERLEEAISACNEYASMVQDGKTFDVVLLDLHLPDSTGLDTVLQFRNAIPKIPIVVLTGLDDEELALQAMEAGAQDYLVKDNTTIQQLVRAIRYAIERNEVLRQLQISEQQTQQFIREARELNLLKSNYISLAAYEARTPLTVIQTVTELLQRSNEQLSEEKQGLYLRQVQAAVTQIRYLLSDLLILGKLDAGQLQFQPIP